MINSEVDENGRQFLIQLFEQTKGDSSVQVSMYDIGEHLGLDRDAASRVAQDLIGEQLVEIRTLSGGIGISANGSKMVKDLVDHQASDNLECTKLGDDPVLNSPSQQVVGQIAFDLKKQVGTFGLDFDTLTELTADLKTLDAQLGSSRPKTAVVRESLRSVLGVLTNLGNSEFAGRIRTLVGS